MHPEYIQWTDTMTKRFEDILKCGNFKNREECFNIIAKEMNITYQQVVGKFYRNVDGYCKLAGFKRRKSVRDSEEGATYA